LDAAGPLDDGVVERHYLVDATVKIRLVVKVNGQETLGSEFVEQWRATFFARPWV